MTETRWDALVARSGNRPTRQPNSDALRSVQRVLPSIDATDLDCDIALALLTAASSGTLRERLAETQARSSRAEAALKSAQLSRGLDPVFSRATLALTLIGTIVFALGASLSFRAVKASSEYIVDDLQTAAISSGIVLAIAGLWFAGTELVRNPFSGTRVGGWGWPFYLVPIAATVAAIVSVISRLRDQNVHGAVGIGLILQFAALALFVVALVGARRNREEAAALKVEAAKTAPAKHLAKHNTQMLRETAWAVSKAPEGELDRDAATAGLRQLYEQARLPEMRIETVLRQLG